MTAGQKLLFDSLPVAGCTNAIRWQLLNPSATVVLETGVCSDFGLLTLATAGTYTIRVYTINPLDATGMYSFKVVNSP